MLKDISLPHNTLNNKFRDIINSGKKFIPFYREISRLKEEINLFTSYSSDTVYRLRYDSMTYDYVSSAIVKLLGFTPEEMGQINFRSLIVEARMVSEGMKVVTSFESLEKARKEGNVDKWQMDYLIRTKDGRKIWVSDISFPWFDVSGKIIGSVGSLRDITDRVNAETRVQNEILRLAHTDPLTGLTNRNSFFSALENELRRFKRSQRHFSILLLDVDHLKKINENFGHQAGDKVLIETSQILNTCLRDTDIAARLGGQEFGLFLPDTTEDGAYWVAERICKEVSKHSFFVDDSLIPLHSTVSIGISSTENNASPTIADLYKIADMRLYIAKHTGRNQVSVDEVLQVH